MAKPCTPHPIAQRVQFFKLQARNAYFLWEGVREGYLFLKKRYPSLIPHSLRGAGNGCSAAALPISLPLLENNQPGGQVMSRPEST